MCVLLFCFIIIVLLFYFCLVLLTTTYFGAVAFSIGIDLCIYHETEKFQDKKKISLELFKRDCSLENVNDPKH